MPVFATKAIILLERKSSNSPINPEILEVPSLPIPEEFILVMDHHGDRETLLLSSHTATTMHQESIPMDLTSITSFSLLTIEIDANDFDDLYYYKLPI